MTRDPATGEYFAAGRWHPDFDVALAALDGADADRYELADMERDERMSREEG
jgi:hypothetical protein